MQKYNKLLILLKDVKKNPKDSTTNFKLGIYWLSLDNLRNALLHFKISIDNDKKNSKYWLYYLFTLFKINDTKTLKESIANLKKLNLKINFEEIYNLHLNFSEIDKFLLNYINFTGYYLSNKFKITNLTNERIALLTNSFLFWFETQEWKDSDLLELGAGNSTFYFSNYFRNITSYEISKVWFKQIKNKIPLNVNLIKTKSILKSLKLENLTKYNVIFVDSSENRANISKEIIKQNFQGVIFFDNSDIYRKSISLFIKQSYIEIPFFGIKPIEPNISCTSILIKQDKLSDLFDSNWVKYPFLNNPLSRNLWDEF